MNDSSGREIITLQVGRYANFVGTHFWNFQDELLLLASRGGVVDAPYDHGVLHRPGTGTDGGGQRTPRLVAFDTRDALGSLNPLGLVGGGGSGGAMATAEAAQSSWTGGVSVFREPAFEKNALHEYLDNEDAEGNIANTDSIAASTGGGYGFGKGYAESVSASGSGEGGGGFGGGKGWGGSRGGDRDGYGVSEKNRQGGDEDGEMEMEHEAEARATGDVARLSKHPFGLDDTVNTWPDFLKSLLHPRALQELPFRDESSDFGVYTSGGVGASGALDEGDRERHSDALRRQLEECDAAQGTQTLVDLEGGWAGLGRTLAVELEEECRNRPRVCYAFLRRADAPAGPGCRVPGAHTGGGERLSSGGIGARSAVNLALGLHGLAEAFSLSVVLDEEACNAETSPYIAVDAGNAYHTSAILGAAVDIATSPLRFSSTGLDVWAGGSGGSGGCGSGVGVPMAGGGGAFGGGGRAPPPGANMTFATLSAWLPHPHPDASADSLAQLLSEHDPRSPRERGGRGQASLNHGHDGRVVSLGPVLRRRRPPSRRGVGLGTGIGRGQAEASGASTVKVYSRKAVWRGFTAPRRQQLDALEQVLHHSGVGSGCSYTVGTPLPIPITYPLLFRESLGLRGELLSTLNPKPPPPQRGFGDASSLMAGGRGQGASPVGSATAGATTGEMRVMCDQISGVAYAERDSDMGSFIGQTAEGLDLRRGGVLLELEKNDMHKDDAMEVLETLVGLAESYGFSQEEEEG